MTAPDIIAQLVERFDRNCDDYRSDRYNETQLRREFLDPFFEALGWDVNNRSGHADAYKDVIHEDAIRVGPATKAPDYSFRIGGTRKFFLEAKKPAVDIQKDPASAYQLRRYAWSAKLPLSILSDFEEMAVYDCRIRPVHSDKASTARVKLIGYAEYLDRWDEIAAIFSKTAVLQGSFDKYARTEKAKRGTAEVDDAFLAEIESWRDTLARNIALRNPALDNRQLNFAVQITIDRLIFLRIAEDRGLERYGELLALVNGPDIYPRLQKLFEKADDRYNSGLFHFTKEKDRPEGPDELTPSLAIDDKPLKDIIKSVYYPCPYEFSVLPAEILGQVYEQFLGKAITLTAGHHARVEEKPEVKKAGGVYYTPAYIVKYIVENTVGKLVEGKTPVEVAKLKILDPACGSGSFLLGAYQFLLDWHLKFYADHDPASWLNKKTPPIVETVSGVAATERSEVDGGTRSVGSDRSSTTVEGVNDLPGASRIPQDPKGPTRIPPDQIRGTIAPSTPPNPEGVERSSADPNALTPNPYILTPSSNPPYPPATYRPTNPASFKLTTSERKRILLNNLFGVDIDSQAVEVTKLSLLLKVLEGQKDLALFAKERALPDLGSNIKCGNSLIGPDFFHGQQLALFDDEEKYKINAFDWPAEFPTIFNAKNPGFDAVIGNPPYIRIQTLKETQPESAEYFKIKYKSAAQGNYDIYVLFIEKGLSVLNRSGVMGYIVPNKFINAQYGKPLRGLIASDQHLSHFVHFKDHQVFENATTYTCLLFLTKASSDDVSVDLVHDLTLWPDSGAVRSVRCQANTLGDSEWNFIADSDSTLFKRLDQMFPKLRDISRIFVGLQTSADPIYIVDATSISQNEIVAFSPALDESVTFEASIMKSLVKGSDIHRYSKLLSDKRLIFPYQTKPSLFPISEQEMKRDFPRTFEYLGKLKSRLLKRGNAKPNEWFLYTYPKNLDQFDHPKIVTGVLAKRASFTYDESGGVYFVGGGNAGGYGVSVNPDAGFDDLYILALLNSSLLDFYVKRISTPFRGGYYSYARRYIEKVPIVQIDPNSAAKKTVDKLVELTRSMLDLHKSLAAAKTPHSQTALQRQIAATDAQIDALVYELYGLTDKEIALIEGQLR